MSSHIAEDVPYFEACLPIEELARRGRDTLRFGPMKPMGLIDPRTGRRPWAVVQLRQENLRADSFNLVGFQNHLKFGEQARILRMIPGLEHAEFLRFGQIHRNTYINAPALLTPTLQLRARPEILFAGQISGVEGYVEAIATGLMAGLHAAELARGASPNRFRARPRSDRFAITSPAPIRATISRRILPSICCRNSTKPLVRDCGTISMPATRRSAAGRFKRWTNTKAALHFEVGQAPCLRRPLWPPETKASKHRRPERPPQLRACLTRMSDSNSKSDGISRNWRAAKPRRTRSNPTVSTCGSFWNTSPRPMESRPPAPHRACCEIREWLADLYSRQLSAVSIRRKLAAVRSLFRFPFARRR